MVAEDLEVLREHFCKHPLDVILMDIEMDVKHDGIIAAKRILDQYPHIRIVFLTAVL